MNKTRWVIYLDLAYSYNVRMEYQYDRYQSPFSWRYGGEKMRDIWSEQNKRLLWREIWVALAESQMRYGLVTRDQLQDLKAHQTEIDMVRALDIESVVHHDLMAELKTFAEQCPHGGKILHLGATSADIQDNADALRIRKSLELLLDKLSKLLEVFARQIETWAETPLIAFTHLQPAEPSTLGYRLAVYAQDLMLDFKSIRTVYNNIKGKGFKGAVGTGASYAQLLGEGKYSEFEADLSSRLDLPFYKVATQIYPRKQEYQTLCALSGMGASLHKYGFDLRLLQSPVIGELGEPFGKQQVGSSAMPFKRNPVLTEKIDSLARLLAQYPRTAWDNAALSALERTLDDSANRRTILPESFLIADELLNTGLSVTSGLKVDELAMAANLSKFGPFASVERVLLALTSAGADRQEMHERLRGHSMQAWDEIRNGGKNPLATLIRNDPQINEYISEDTILPLMEVSEYVGDAPHRAREIVQEIRNILSA